MEIAITVLLLIVGLVLIIKGGDFFVDAASWMAEASGIPKLIVGATVVSFATTLPELLVSIFAALDVRASAWQTRAECAARYVYRWKTSLRPESA